MAMADETTPTNADLHTEEAINIAEDAVMEYKASMEDGKIIYDEIVNVSKHTKVLHSIESRSQ